MKVMKTNILNRVVIALLFIAMAWGVVGCQDEECSTINGSSSSDMIAFSPMVNEEDEETRGTIIIEDFETGDDMGVYAYRLPSDGSVDPTTISPNFMYNQQVIKQEDGSWLYTPTKYWSNDVNDKYTFFSYAPYSANEANTTYTENRTGYPIFVHTSPPKMIDSRDLVLAGRKCTKDVGTVQLIFEHVLSRLRFEFRNDLISDNETYSMVVKSIKLQNVTTQSAFTFEDYEESDYGLRLKEAYMEEEKEVTGDITADIESGALIGAGDYQNGYSTDAYITYNASAQTEYTSITTEGEYLFIDPYVIGNSKVILAMEIEIYADDGNSTVHVWELALSNTTYLDVTDKLEAMERGHSYVWQISYQPLEGSGLMVYVLNTWDDVYNKHDM